MSSHREVVLDTETTGLNPSQGDRIIEIGCIELINHIPTGESLQIFFNPETKMVSDEAVKIHGLKNNFLVKQPYFRERVNDIIKFIANDTLVIHNASFDLGFINKELEYCKKDKLTNPIIDTIELAKKKSSGGSVSLDALCKKFNIDKSKREFHGALLDSQLLAEVYIELLGGRQKGLEFFINTATKDSQKDTNSEGRIGNLKKINICKEDASLHKDFIKHIKNAIWNNYN